MRDVFKALAITAGIVAVISIFIAIEWAIGYLLGPVGWVVTNAILMLFTFIYVCVSDETKQRKRVAERTEMLKEFRPRSVSK